MSGSRVAILAIERGVAGRSCYTERFEVPCAPGASVLDGLRWIREHVDSSLAFRFSCINANVCKECVMRVDGEVEYACTARLTEGEMRIQPLANKPVLRDLVCATVPRKERLEPRE